jgi:TPR repeat protein
MKTSSNHHKFAQIMECINEFIQHLKQDDSLKIKYENADEIYFHLQKAFEYYKISSKKGLKEADWTVASFNSYSRDEYKSSLAFARKASNKNLIDDVYALGQIFYSHKSDQEAFACFKRGSQANHSLSIYWMGILTEYGCGVQKEFQ